MSTWESIKNRTWEEWLAGGALTFTGGQALQKYGWRRPLRTLGAGAKGTGRFARASALTMNDFYRAQSNKPFAWEPHVAPGAAVALYAATPVMMVYAAHKYPLVTKETMGGSTNSPSIGIGSAGHGLIYGGLDWSWLPWL